MVDMPSNQTKLDKDSSISFIVAPYNTSSISSNSRL